MQAVAAGKYSPPTHTHTHISCDGAALCQKYRR